MTDQLSWILLCGALVFFMQAGFTCHEAGFVQSKNVIAVSTENLLTFGITVLVFLFFGYPLMFGQTMFHMTTEEYCTAFFQTMCAAVAVTVFAGAMAERSKLAALLVASVFIAGLIYPMYACWAWGPGSGPFGGWLRELGYMDSSGAGVVHLTAGAVSLAGLMIVGPRKEVPKGKANITLATLGVFILCFGWLGFNGGRATELAQIPLIFINTMVAASTGIFGALFSNLLYRRKGRYLISTFNGALGGLVAIAAVSGYSHVPGALLIGFVAGIVADSIWELLEKSERIDDVVSAVPVHFGGGITGLLMVPFVIDKADLTGGNLLIQLGVQVIALAVNFVWVFGGSWLVFKAIDKTIGIRVSESEEKKGLNILEFNDLYSWESYMEISSYEAEINEKNKELKHQAKVLSQTEEREKTKLAHELHDGLGQSLATLKLILKMSPEKTSAQALELAETSLQEMRNVLNDLSPVRLKDGLDVGLEAMVENLSSIDGFTCTFEHNDDFPVFEKSETLNLYRLIQEGLTNVVKHSGATKANVICEKNDRLFVITIRDNGHGFAKEDIDTGLGLKSMAERAKMMDGTFVVHSGEEGTEIRVEVPIYAE